MANDKIMKDPNLNTNALIENGIYLFMEGVNKDSCRKAIEFILMHNFQPAPTRLKHLQFMISSPGGDLSACFALIDIMKGSKIPIHTVGLGQICSCGILLFMTGEPGYRTLTPNTSILSHQFSWGSVGKEHELFASVKEFELTKKRMIEHYKKCTGMDEKTIKEFLLPPEDVWLDAKEAVKYGIADKVKKIY